MTETLQKQESFYKTLFKIALPITLQSLIQSSLNIIDQLMIGKLGEFMMTTITLSNKLFNIFLYIIFALTGGCSIFIAQFWGKNDRKNISKTLKIPFLVGFLTIAIFLFIVIFFPNQSMRLFTNDENVVLLGGKMQKLYFISALPVLLINIYATLARSTCHVKLPLITGMISMGTNTLLNYILIFGKLGIEPMGIKGAVIATVIARFLEAILLLTIIHTVYKTIAFNPITMIKSKLDNIFIKRFIKSLWPLLTLNIVFVLADTVYSSVYGKMGTNDMAAMTTMFPIQGFSIGLFAGFSSATAIILGTKLGEKQFDLAINYSKRILKTTAIITIGVSAIIVAISDFYLGFYNIKPEVFANSKKLIFVSAIFLCVRVLNMVIGQGIIQSGGNTKYMLFLDLIGMWCFGVPLAYISAFVLDCPIYIVYLIISLEEVIRLVLGMRKVRSKDWARNLVDDISD